MKDLIKHVFLDVFFICFAEEISWISKGFKLNVVVQNLKYIRALNAYSHECI